MWLFGIVFYLSIISWMLNSWISIWLVIEITMLFIIGLIRLGNNYDGRSLIIKYYIIQLLISLSFLFSALVSVINLVLKSNLVCLILLIAKLGFFPFHFWIILILGKIDWQGFFILRSFIKLPPLRLVYYLLELINITFMIFSSILIGRCLGFNNTIIQKLLGYSSLIHLCWLLLRLYIRFNFYWLYFLFYTSMIIILTVMFSYLNIFYLSQIKMGLFRKFYRLTIFFSVLRLAGFPPFIGFLMKWILGRFITFYRIKFIVFSIVFFSLLSVGFYFQLFYYFILILRINLKLWAGFVNKTFILLVLYFLFSFYLGIYFL